MSLLSRELFRQYGRLMLIFGLGICALFVLIEGPARAQSMAGADSLFWVLVRYFGARLPAVMSIYLPVCGLLAGIVLLCANQRSREAIALYSGGVPYARLACLVLICGLFWSGVQFFLEQHLGLQGQKYAADLYREKIGQASSAGQIRDIWFADGEYLVHLETIDADGSGHGLWAIRNQPGQGPLEMISAESFQGQTGEWLLSQVRIVRPETFFEEEQASLTLSLNQAPRLFFVTGGESRPQELPYWVLYDSMRGLAGAGTDLAPFRTAWHECFAYALLCAAFSLAAAAIVSLTPNLYLAILLGLGAALGGISINSSLIGLGTAGSLAPALAAWTTPLLISLLAALRLTWSHFQR